MIGNRDASTLDWSYYQAPYWIIFYPDGSCKVKYRKGSGLKGYLTYLKAKRRPGP